MLNDLIQEYIRIVGFNPQLPHTSLYTSGFFLSYIERIIELDEASETGKKFSIAVIDIDSFSAVLKSSGYMVGDIIIKTLAEIIGRTIRDSDIAAHFGGNTFIIFLNNIKPEECYLVIDRIRISVTEKISLNISVSTGLSGYPFNGKDVETLKKYAFNNLNRAKMRGGNKIISENDWKIDESGFVSSILIVDDDPKNRKLISAMIDGEEYEIYQADSGNQALSILKKVPMDLVILDVMMPGMDGFEVCKIIKNTEDTWETPVILITALNDIESKIKGIESGADDFLTKPPSQEELIARTKSLIRLRHLHHNYSSIENVLFSLANAVEAKDNYTQGHTERVSALSERIGRYLNLKESEIVALRLGGILHDVGKIAIPEEILNKPGPLTSDEFKIMQTHTEIGYNICLPLYRSLGGALDIIRHHHEKLDGSSYPDGLKDDAITLQSRIIAVVDIYDALTTERPYRKAMDREKALSILKSDSDKKMLDENVVKALTELVNIGEGKFRRKSDRMETEQKTILIVEDDLLNIKLMKHILVNGNFKVESVVNGDEVTAAVEHCNPDLIIMDIELPGMNGLGATALLKQNEKYQNIPVVIVSSFSDKKNMDRAKKIGCSGFIKKPFDTRSFVNTISGFIQ